MFLLGCPWGVQKVDHLPPSVPKGYIEFGTGLGNWKIDIFDAKNGGERYVGTIPGFFDQTALRVAEEPCYYTFTVKIKKYGREEMNRKIHKVKVVADMVTYISINRRIISEGPSRWKGGMIETPYLYTYDITILEPKPLK